MALEIKVEGGATLARVAAQIRDQGRKDLSRQLSTALNKVTAPIRKEIEKEAGEAMPSSGGYSAELTKSLRFRNNRRAGGQQATLTMITYADGKTERRDVVALEHGLLRHPHYGNRNKWYVTKVRAGFHERGTERAGDEAVAALAEVVRDFSQKLIQ
jgi:hypothetical protein